MFNIKTLSIAGFALALSSGSAFADTYYDYARVIKAKPVYHYVTVSQPVEQCYPVKKRRYLKGHHGDRTGSTVAGAVLGGVIGNVIGDNRESTVAGAIIGGALGHTSSHKRYHSTRVVEHCDTVYEKTRKVREIKGYKVKYRYQGEKYKTFMRQHPGDKIKVRVRVSPVGYD
ncbi:glycine zipper 2TM domain-containing protein [Aliiglaciecola sp. M165]|uniref:glycine zipper 2TM domain-containing protein n=1 Tax=Aliiglaciecola sp. M165 TaxID=2593649 RepID=UPI00117F7EBB|nr:glycine zipper 2TM domain-containing protein [Aliiglaciecola sp. M165]TRY30360.1 glycine zipper 2TM domain-containing protein [Aliiglaciecola sp. M165]